MHPSDPNGAKWRSRPSWGGLGANDWGGHPSTAQGVGHRAMSSGIDRAPSAGNDPAEEHRAAGLACWAGDLSLVHS